MRSIGLSILLLLLAGCTREKIVEYPSDPIAVEGPVAVYLVDSQPQPTISGRWLFANSRQGVTRDEVWMFTPPDSLLEGSFRFTMEVTEDEHDHYRLPEGQTLITDNRGEYRLERLAGFWFLYLDRQAGQFWELGDDPHWHDSEPQKFAQIPISTPWDDVLIFSGVSYRKL